jgi:hypothetical protein
VTIAVINGPDTLYHVSDSEGKFAFTEISSGVWLVQAQGDVPPSLAYEHSQFSLATSPGEEVHVEFRLLPRKRPVILEEPVVPPLKPESPPRRNNR